MNEFKDRVAVITGAASGIGRAIAENFGQEGMKVVISDIEEEALSHTEAKLKEMGFDVLALTTDVSEFEDVKNLDLYSYAKFV
ncbi:MAG: SDR family NAD(P)-dependent oxidoreductase [Candidatus Hodarchaeota archaeon]